jgi:hypothetical protein
MSGLSWRDEFPSGTGWAGHRPRTGGDTKPLERVGHPNGGPTNSTQLVHDGGEHLRIQWTWQQLGALLERAVHHHESRSGRASRLTGASRSYVVHQLLQCGQPVACGAGGGDQVR